MKRIILAAAACLILAVPPARAQDDGADEIVVTGARASQRNAVYAQVPIPAVSMTQRADFVLVDLTVSSDSRDPGVRRQEIQRTLEALAQRARGGAVTLALQQDDTVRPFSTALAMRLLSGGHREDTDQVLVMLRTAVMADDTLDTARQRLQAFANSVPGSGRALAEISSDVALSLRDIPNYRTPLITAITADANAIAGALGPGYRAQLTGLENPVAWRKSGDLQLTLFINYRMNMTAAE
jgi:hypothetical protein